MHSTTVDVPRVPREIQQKSVKKDSSDSREEAGERLVYYNGDSLWQKKSVGRIRGQATKPPMCLHGVIQGGLPPNVLVVITRGITTMQESVSCIVNVSALVSSRMNKQATARCPIRGCRDGAAGRAGNTRSPRPLRRPAARSTARNLRHPGRGVVSGPYRARFLLRFTGLARGIQEACRRQRGSTSNGPRRGACNS